MFRILILCLLPLLLPVGCREERPRPNVLLIVLDTVRGDRCSVNGYDRPTTPGLERIAAEGVTFRDAWSPAGWTGPAHASVFTGLRPEHHGFLTGNRMHLRDEVVTLAERLAGAGYRTACLTNNAWLGPTSGLTQGFEEFDSITSRPDEEYPTCRWAHRSALRLARHAGKSGRPCFIVVNDMEAHLPYTPLPEEQQRFLAPGTPPELLREARKFDTEDALLLMSGAGTMTAEKAAVLGDLYDAEIAGLDAEVEAFVRTLDEEGLLEDTLLVIVSDHGENLGDHGVFAHKADLHRSLRHVLMILRYPGRFDGGREVEEVVRLEDLFPTILEICGVEVPEGIDGESLTGRLDGRVARGAYGISGGKLEVPPEPPGRDFSRFTLSFRSVYDGRFHLLRDSEGREELYDVSSDPLERRNLGPDETEAGRRRRRLLPR